MTAPAGPIDWEAVEVALRDWVVSSSGLPEGSVIWAQQGRARPEAPWISLNVKGVEEVGIDWTDFEDRPLEFPAIAATVDPATDLLSAPAHGRATGDGPVRLAAAGFPGGTDGATDYWLRAADADHLGLATSFLRARAGQLVDLTSAGSGVTATSTDQTTAAGAELSAKTRGQFVVTMSIQCFATSATGVADAVSILQRACFRARTGPVIAALNAAGVGVRGFSKILSVGQVVSTTVFEPRTTTDMTFFLAGEVEDPTTFVAQVTGTDQTRSPGTPLDAGRRSGS